MTIRTAFSLSALLLCQLLAPSATAERVRPPHRAASSSQPDHFTSVATRYAAKLDSVKRVFLAPQTDSVAVTSSNPYFALLLGSPVLYHSVLRQTLGTLPEETSSFYLGRGISEETDLLIGAQQSLLRSVYAHEPWFVVGEEDGKGTLNLDTAIKEGATEQTTLTDQLKKKETAAPPSSSGVLKDDADLGIIVRKPNFWTFKTDLSLQFTQNYVSDNWYKGGESNNALLATVTIDANFNNKKKISWDNKLEMRLGFQTSRDDSEHKFRTNTDLLRLTNKLGLRATKHWYYTMTLQSWTQFYKGYKKNDPKVYSDFMSPFESLLSLGMDYEAKLKRFQISASLSPIAVKFKSVSRKGLATSFGINEGHRTDWSYGSNITVKYSWQIAKNIKYDARIYFFSDYSKTQIEWENTVNLSINKYLSTKLFFYPRFDDARQRKEGESYFQFKELLSLGLNMNF